MTVTDELLANNDAHVAGFDKGELPLPAPARSRGDAGTGSQTPAPGCRRTTLPWREGATPGLDMGAAAQGEVVSPASKRSAPPSAGTCTSA
jgi:hypothetical protein